MKNNKINTSEILFVDEVFEANETDSIFSNRRREVKEMTVQDLIDAQDEELASAEDFPPDHRPHLWDKESRQWVLLDTGAACTV